MLNPRTMLLLWGTATVLTSGPFEVIKSSLDRLRKNHPGAVEDIQPDSHPRRIVLRELDLASTPWKVKLLAAEWLLRAHVLSTRQNPTGLQDPVLLNRAWELAAVSRDQATSAGKAPRDLYRGPDPNLRVAAAQALNNSLSIDKLSKEINDLIMWLQVEISVRLNDLSKMKTALSTFSHRADMDPRAQTYAMMAAFHTGAWAMASTAGQALAVNPRIGKNIHEQAKANPQAFDYSALLLWLEQLRPAAFEGPLRLAQAQVKDCRFRLKEVAGADKALVEQARGGISPEWKTTSEPVHALQVVGAVSHWLMPFGNQMALSGSLQGDRLSLLGYQDQPEGRCQDLLEINRQTSEPNRWRGLLTCSTPPAKGLTYTFEVDLELVWEQPISTRESSGIRP